VAVCYGPPEETTYRGIPLLSQVFQDLLNHLRGAEKAIKSVYEWSCTERRRALEGDAPLGRIALDALAHPIRPAATLTLAAVEGTEVCVTASEPPSPRDAVPFSSNDVGRHLEAADGRAIITAVESTTRATVRILTPFTTTGPISAGEWGIERVSREEFQRMANEEREKTVDRYYRVGDRVLDVPLIQELDMRLAKLCELTPAVEKHIDSIKNLAGARPALVARGGGRNVAAYRTIAAEVAERINKSIPDRRWRSRTVGGISLDDYENHGLYRAEVLERTKAILHAVYGASMTETDIKTAAQKRRPPKVKPAKK
jgi:hypothetical protein